ncbi:MAG: ABC transporter substrate-binding protein [Chloroflexi bacterium]|nr:ABC transporter substrate-binding protein [Chloroflexota bacterium]
MQPLAQRAKIKLAIAPGNMDSLPLFLGLDDGAFTKAGLDPDVTKIQGSATAVLPQLAQGQVDFLLVGVGPGLYNQAAQGFGAKIVASDGIEKAGRFTADMLNVQRDQANQIRDRKDLKGKVVDGALAGSPIDMLARAAIDQAGLTIGKDVTLNYNAKTPPDMIALAKNKGADVIGMTEPIATQAQQQNLTVKWKNDADIIPWYQPGEVAVSQSLLSSNPAAVEKFLEVYVSESRKINAANGQWTDELIASATKWTDVPADVVKAMGGVPYFDPNGAVSMDSLRMTQDFWVKAGQIKTPVDINGLVDASHLAAVTKAIGTASS